MSDTIGQQLLELKGNIESDEAKHNRKRGELDALLARLKKDFKIADLNAAERFLAKEQKVLAQEEEALHKLIDEIEKEYVWEG